MPCLGAECEHRLVTPGRARGTRGRLWDAVTAGALGGRGWGVQRERRRPAVAPWGHCIALGVSGLQCRAMPHFGAASCSRAHAVVFGLRTQRGKFIAWRRRGEEKERNHTPRCSGSAGVCSAWWKLSSRWGAWNSRVGAAILRRGDRAGWGQGWMDTLCQMGVAGLGAVSRAAP